jgi:hypothetical protein
MGQAARMSRILFLGDSAGTGFGTVTRDLGSGLLALGEDVRFLSLNEQPEGDLPEPFKGRTAILDNPNGWLADHADPEIAARTVARLEGMFTGALFEDGWTPDAGIVLGDVASVKMSPIAGFVPEGFPIFHYVPIEGDGLPPAWANVWRNLRPVAMSRFGADEIARIMPTRPPVVYHGVNTDDFWTVSPARPIYVPTSDGQKKLHSKADCKRSFGLEAGADHAAAHRSPHAAEDVPRALPIARSRARAAPERRPRVALRGRRTRAATSPMR